MKFRLNRQVEKDLKKIKDKAILLQFREFLERIKRVSTLNELENIKKIKGERNYYRYRFGNYRAGFKLEDNDGQMGTGKWGRTLKICIFWCGEMLGRSSRKNKKTMWLKV